MFEILITDSVKAEWKLRPLGDVCDFQGGTQPPKSTFIYKPKSGYVRLLQIRDFESDDNPAYIRTDRNFRMVDEDDVLLARYGASVGKILTGKRGAINVAIMKTLPNEDYLFKNYLYYLLQAKPFYKFLRGLGGRSAQAGFNKGEVGSFVIPLPPLPEQRAIAGVLRAVQEAKEATERVIAAAREFKASLMKHLFTYGPVPFDEADRVNLKETEIGLMPEEWEISDIGTELELIKYGTSKKCKTSTGGNPVLRIPNVIGGEIDTSVLKYLEPDESEIKRFHLDSGDILFVRTNGQKDYVGRCAVYRDYPPESLFASYLIKVRMSKNIIPEFLKLYAATEVGKSFLSEKATCAADGKFNINTGIIKNMKFPMPGIETQRKIVECIETVETIIHCESARLEALSDLFDSLLHNLMTGQIRVPINGEVGA